MLASQIEADILRRVLGTDRNDLTPAAAGELLRLGFSEADHARMAELSVRAQEGSLGEAERAELEGFVSVSRFVAFVHSKARLALKRAGSDSHAA